MNKVRNVKHRIWFILSLFGLATISLCIQLVRVQFGPFAPVFSAQASESIGPIERKYPDRGLIFDRDGTLLASNASLYFLEVETRQLSDQSIIDIPLVISELLQLDKADLETQLFIPEDDTSWYRFRLTYETAGGKRYPIQIDRVAASILEHFLDDPMGPDLSGLALVPMQKRIYPAGELMGHVLGFVSQEGKGYFGVEEFYNDWLSGKPVDVQRVLIPLEAGINPDPMAGANLVLTIDLEIQQSATTLLKQAIERAQAESGQIIVMDPSNGEILAMVALPALDPENYEKWLLNRDEGNLVITPAVASQYEPGSTFKVLVMAAALNENVVSPNDEFIDTGEIEVGGHIIRNWDGEAYGLQTMTACMQYSLNTCLAYVGSQKLQSARFYAAMRSFGIGSLTGIDLAGEVKGQLRVPGDIYWTESDIGTNSFGQGVSVTPIQLLTAFSAVANDGMMVLPHIVREVSGPQGEYWTKTTILGRPISSETAQTLNKMLIQTMGSESKLSLVQGYTLAGKTGTAQIPTDYGYDPHWTIASFIGWGPIEDPRFLVFVRIDKPQSSPWGSEVAAPVFKQIVEQLVIQLGIPPKNVVNDLVLGDVGDE
jgi:cell division protein FtsI/penicillin-binding protein 2